MMADQKIFIFALFYAGNSTSGHRLCPRGFYCPSNTGMDWMACPNGTYSNELGLMEESECQQCTGQVDHYFSVCVF